MSAFWRYLTSEQATNRLVVIGIVLGILFGMFLPEWGWENKP